MNGKRIEILAYIIVILSVLNLIISIIKEKELNN